MLYLHTLPGSEVLPTAISFACVTESLRLGLLNGRPHSDQEKDLALTSSRGMLNAVCECSTHIKAPVGRREGTGKACRERFRSPRAVSHLSFELCPLLASSLFARGGELNESAPSTSGRPPTDVPYVQFPVRQNAEPSTGQRPHMVRVRLHVQYRVHSRQVLCIGGSQLPFGWSFLSIAKFPLAWNPGDMWSTEVSLNLF